MSKLVLTSDDLWKRAEKRKLMRWNEFECREDSSIDQVVIDFTITEIVMMCSNRGRRVSY